MNERMCQLTLRLFEASLASPADMKQKFTSSFSPSVEEVFDWLVVVREEKSLD